MKVNCQKCGVEFKTFPSVVNQGHGKYCSRECCTAASISNRKPIRNKKVSKVDLVNDLLRVSRELGRRPTKPEYKKLGKYGCTWVWRHGGFKAIWESLGLKFKAEAGFKYVKDDLVIDDLRRVAKQLGHPPNCKEYPEKGSYSCTILTRKLKVKHWYQVLLKVFDLSERQIANLTPPRDRTLEMWLELYRELAEKLNRPPSSAEAHLQLSANKNIYPVLQGISHYSLLVKAGLALPLTNEEIIRDVVRVARLTGGKVTTEKYRKYGKFRIGTIQGIIGWGKIKELAGQQLQPKPQPIKHLSHVPDASRDRLKESSVEAIKDFFNQKG